MEKPVFDEYFTETGQKYPGAMKKYIIETLRWLQEQGNEEALEIPIEMLEQELDEDIVAMDPAQLQPLGRLLMMKLIRSSFANEIFDEMLKRVGSSIDEIRKIRENGTHRKMPGMPYSDAGTVMTQEEQQEAMFEMLKMEIHKKIAPALIKAGATGDVNFLKERLKDLEEAAESALKIVGDDPPEEAVNDIQELLDYTEIYIRMVDAEQTTPEHFNRFMNTLLTEFIDNKVKELNEEIQNHDHKGHDDDECNLMKAKDFPVPVMHTLWRRYYSDDETTEPEFPRLEAMQDISCVLFDAFNNQIEFTGLTFHPSLEHVIVERMNEKIPQSDDLREEIFKIFTRYVKNNPDLMQALQNQHADDERMAILVSMDIACPTLAILDKCYVSSQSEPDDLISGSDLDAALAELLNEG